jgi:hypothetical protein
MKGHHDVCVFKAGDRYRVRPAVWSSKGEKASGKPHSEFNVRNLTDRKVLLVFDPGMLDPAQSPEVMIDAARTTPGPSMKDSATIKLQVKAIGDVPATYPYSVIVFTATGPVAAEGESEPVVIIDPPPA